MNQICIACGMPMTKPEDHAMGDTEKNYCVHCSRADGAMQSFDEKLNSLAAFIVKTQGLADSVATETARAMMLKLPAWKDQ